MKNNRRQSQQMQMQQITNSSDYSNIFSFLFVVMYCFSLFRQNFVLEVCRSTVKMSIFVCCCCCCCRFFLLLLSSNSTSSGKRLQYIKVCLLSPLQRIKCIEMRMTLALRITTWLHAKRSDRTCLTFKHDVQSS